MPLNSQALRGAGDRSHLQPQSHAGLSAAGLAPRINGHAYGAANRWERQPCIHAAAQLGRRLQQRWGLRLHCMHVDAAAARHNERLCHQLG